MRERHEVPKSLHRIPLNNIPDVPLYVDGNPIKTLNVSALRSMVPSIELEDGSMLADNIHIDTQKFARFMQFAGMRRITLEKYTPEENVQVNIAAGGENGVTATHVVATTREETPSLDNPDMRDMWEELMRGEAYGSTQSNSWAIGRIPLNSEKIRQIVQRSQEGQTLRSPEAWANAINQELVEGMSEIAVQNLLGRKHLKTFAELEVGIQAFLALLYVLTNVINTKAGNTHLSPEEFFLRLEVFPHAFMTFVSWGANKFARRSARLTELGAFGPELTRSAIVKTIGLLAKDQPRFIPHLITAKKDNS